MSNQPPTVAPADPSDPRWLEYVPLDELVRAPRNPKGHDGPSIRDSLTDHGYVEPIVHDERTGYMVVGHGRLDELVGMRDTGEDPPEGLIAGDTGWLVPVLRGWGSKDDDDAERYLVRSNQLTTAGGWDMTELAAMMQDLNSRDPANLDGLGFRDHDLEVLLAATLPEFDPGDPDGDLDDFQRDDGNQHALRFTRDELVHVEEAIARVRRLTDTPDMTKGAAVAALARWFGTVADDAWTPPA